MSIPQVRRRIKRAVLLAVCASGLAAAALAHASEQGFVLLLPTRIYSLAGAAAVALTVLVLAVVPDRALSVLFRTLTLLHCRRAVRLRHLTSCLAFLGLLGLLWLGGSGPRDPLANPLPLFVWTLWWIALVTLQGLLGDLWGWINPWSGPVALTRRWLGAQRPLRLPGRLGHGPAIAIFLGFAALLMVDPAPTDPGRLARLVGLYWLFNYLALLAFGPRWERRGDGIAMLMRSYARIGLFGRRESRLALGLTGWQALGRHAPPLGVAVFYLLMLGSGSFDGLNETFWWLVRLGVNPLEYPGRSALIAQNLAGLLTANAALILAYALAIRLGLRLIASDMPPNKGFCLFAPSILPIALGYHIAHYLPSFLVDSQYALAAASDPLARGDDLLGLGTFYVTTGFFNTPGTVRAIWLTQAGAVVLGHMLAVTLAHVLAVRHLGPGRRAALAQAPLALFMVLYTLFGLWLLASPRGA